MQLPLQITTRDIELTPAIENAIRSRISKLETFYDRIMGCRVMIEAPHRHHHKGVLFNVRIRLTVPGGELTVGREPHEDLYVAIRDACNAARRQLQEFSRRQRGDVKHHEESRLSEKSEETGETGPTADVMPPTLASNYNSTYA
ncbi:MAG: ribosomal subunit interface protein [Gammaproteobacteria bacterium RBG_16_57_12]|nr:MAG: ribosomal subunit interface protein [Gammaproteobacteria bacterium RBG_16_57_12]